MKTSPLRWPEEELGEPPEYFLDWQRLHDDVEVETYSAIACADRLIEQLLWRMSKMKNVRASWMIRANEYEMRLHELEDDVKRLYASITTFASGPRLKR